MSRFQFGIVGKIMSGYLTILLVNTIVITFCLISLSRNRNMDNQVSEVYYPTLLYLKDVGAFANETSTLTNNWIYQPSEKDKDRLKNLHTEEYKRLKEEMEKISLKIEIDSEKETLNLLSKNLE